MMTTTYKVDSRTGAILSPKSSFRMAYYLVILTFSRYDNSLCCLNGLPDGMMRSSHAQFEQQPSPGQSQIGTSAGSD
jgi:hypothetical protein